jgi:hypothetical protein
VPVNNSKRNGAHLKDPYLSKCVAIITEKKKHSRQRTMATRRPTSSSSYLRTFTVVLLCAFCCALWSSAGGLVAAEMHMMDMPVRSESS